MITGPIGVTLFCKQYSSVYCESGNINSNDMILNELTIIVISIGKNTHRDGNPCVLFPLEMRNS